MDSISVARVSERIGALFGRDGSDAFSSRHLENLQLRST